MKTLICPMLIALTLAAAPLAAEPKARPIPQPTRTPPPPENPRAQLRTAGIVVAGATAPDFELPDAHGKPLRLSQLRGGYVLLLFSDRKEGVRVTRELVEPMGDLDVRMIGVCREQPQALRSFADRDSIPARLLADAKGEVAAVFGAYDFVRSTVIPGLFLLDPHGTIMLAVTGPAFGAAQIAQLTHFAITAYAPDAP